MDRSALVRDLVLDLLGEDLRSGAAPVAVRLPDGSLLGSPDAAATLVVRSDDALRHIARAPGELGFARAYVSGALDLEGDLWAVLALRDRIPEVGLTPAQVARLVKDLGVDALRNPPPVPPEEIRVGSTWRAHARDRDATAISHHYDVSNDFYRLVLGPSMTYSCAVFEHEHDGLARAQANKHELICRKLALRPGQRLLDVGCGWGSLVLHAARHHGVDAVGVTISHEQARLARKRVAEAGLTDRVEIRVQDYRDVVDGPYDAVSSVGMFEHVGEAQMRTYFARLRDLLRPGGRLLNHQIGRTPQPPKRFRRARPRVHPRRFVHRYVFPDGELHEVGTLVSALQQQGFEVRHLESIREHYGRTLRHWVANLEANWDEAVALTSEGRARVWRLYMAGSAALFEANLIQVHQILAVKPDDGASGMPLRHGWDGDLADPRPG
jgi:cyclopropane-fatty-acyl-phospholipid synthase